MSMLNEFEKTVCRVCGRIQADPPWGEDGNCPTYIICGCCGVEFGYGDFTLKAIHFWRKRWLSQGAKWHYEEEKPIDWVLEDQMKNIPLEFR